MANRFSNLIYVLIFQEVYPYMNEVIELTYYITELKKILGTLWRVTKNNNIVILYWFWRAIKNSLNNFKSFFW